MGPLVLRPAGTVPGMTLPLDPRDDQARIPQQPPADRSWIEMEGPEQRAEAKRRRRWWIPAVVVGVLAAGGGTAYALIPTDEDRAVDRCQQSVTAKLKSPSTASYGEKTTVVVERGDFATYYKVFGTVDAQNAFGATIRGVYRCEVNRERDGSWLVTSTTLA